MKISIDISVQSRAPYLLWLGITSWTLIFVSWNAQAETSVGVSIPLTGEARTYGADIRNALEFANEELAGGAYKLIFEDDRCSGKEAVSVAQKFAQSAKVKFVLGLPCSGSLLSAAPVYEKAGIVVISSGASSPAVSRAGDHVFRTWPSDVEAAHVLRRYVGKNHRSVGIISEQTDFNHAFADAFRSSPVEAGLQIVEEEFPPGADDHRALLTRLRSKSLEALFINTQTEASLLTVVKQIRALKIELPIYNAFWASSPSFLSSAGSLAEGIIFVDSPLPDEVLSKEGAELYRRFIQRYGEMNSKPLLFVTAFESFRAMQAAHELGDSTISFLTSHTFPGSLGEWRFTELGDPAGAGSNTYLPMTISVIEKGIPKRVLAVR